MLRLWRRHRARPAPSVVRLEFVQGMPVAFLVSGSPAEVKAWLRAVIDRR